MSLEVPETLKRAAATRDSAEVETVSELIRRMKQVDHSTLLKRASNRGLNAAQVKRAVSELYERGEIAKPTYEPAGHGKTKLTYQWGGI